MPALRRSRPPLRSDGTEPDPRFSFANERTFLAWMRTALALITAGLAVTQLLPPLELPGGRRLIGLPLIGLGILIAAVSYRQWERNERAMRRREPLPPSPIAWIVVVVVGMVAAVAFVLALVSVPS